MIKFHISNIKSFLKLSNGIINYFGLLHESATIALAEPRGPVIWQLMQCNHLSLFISSIFVLSIFIVFVFQLILIDSTCYLTINAMEPSLSLFISSIFGHILIHMEFFWTCCKVSRLIQKFQTSWIFPAYFVQCPNSQPGRFSDYLWNVSKLVHEFFSRLPGSSYNGRFMTRYSDYLYTPWFPPL